MKSEDDRRDALAPKELHKDGYISFRIGCLLKEIDEGNKRPDSAIIDLINAVLTSERVSGGSNANFIEWPELKELRGQKE